MSADSKHSQQGEEDSKVDENTIDVALMTLAKEGNLQAFEQLVLRHQQPVIGTIAKMLNNHSDSEDIAQQVFIRLWKSAANYTPKAKFTTFLYTITRNLVFNESRRLSKKKNISIEEKSEDSHFDISDSSEYQPDKTTLQNELQNAVDKAISELPETQRLAIVLRKYEQLSYEEIADVLELSVSAVKSQLFRARAALKLSLDSYLNS